jgi:hypothetical protein
MQDRNGQAGPHRNIHEYAGTTRITQEQAGTCRIRPEKQEQDEHAILGRTGSSRQERAPRNRKEQEEHAGQAGLGKKGRNRGT